MSHTKTTIEVERETFEALVEAVTSALAWFEFQTEEDEAVHTKAVLQAALGKVNHV